MHFYPKSIQIRTEPGHLTSVSAPYCLNTRLSIIDVKMKGKPEVDPLNMYIKLAEIYPKNEYGKQVTKKIIHFKSMTITGLLELF